MTDHSPSSPPTYGSGWKGGGGEGTAWFIYFSCLNWREREPIRCDRASGLQSEVDFRCPFFPCGSLCALMVKVMNCVCITFCWQQCIIFLKTIHMKTMLIRPYVGDASFIIILNVFSQSCRKLSLGKGPMSLLLVVLVFCHTLPPCGHYQELYKKEVNETYLNLS